MMSFNVDKGRHLSLVIDTKDPHDVPANKTDFSVDILFGGGKEASLTAPYIN